MSDPTDIVERLRRTAQSLGSAVVILTAAEGEQIADEIVRLREANGELTLHLNDTRQKLQPGDWKRLMADWASDE
jgi:hypothetical protein